MIAVYILISYCAWALLSFFCGWFFPEISLLIKQSTCRHVDSFGMDWKARQGLFKKNKHYVYPGSRCVRCGKTLHSNNFFKDKKGL